MTKKMRSHLEILAEMVYNTKYSIGVCRLMEDTNIEYKRLKKYVEEALRSGFIEAVSRRKYRATKKGLKFYETVQQAKDMLVDDNG